MAFPTTPNVNDTHTEGTREYLWTGAAWIIQAPTVTGTNLSATPAAGDIAVGSSTGTGTTIPAATATLAGVMPATDKVKLDTVEANAAADQVATEVPFTATGNTTSTDVQGAIVELQTELDNLNIAGLYKGSAATVAGLPAGANGDWAILNVDDGGNQSGIWVTDGTTYTLAKEIAEPLAINAATDAAAGIVELATTAEATTGTDTTRAVTPAGLKAATDALAADSLANTGLQVTHTPMNSGTPTNHDLRTPTGAALPADDTNSRLFVLLGHASLPDALYSYSGGAWFQV